MIDSAALIRDRIRNFEKKVNRLAIAKTTTTYENARQAQYDAVKAIINGIGVVSDADIDIYSDHLRTQADRLTELFG